MNFFHTTITDQAKENERAVLDEGFLSEGSWVDDFEQGIEDTFGYRNCVAVNSCTSALHLALILAGVKPGDEVILPAQTFLATGLAVLYCGAKPVFADIERATGNIDPFKAWEKITEKTKAIISVAWGGTPPDFKHLEEITIAGIAVIQDNAHALGSIYNDKPIADFGDFSCFSFQAIKQLTTGDGGLLVCRNPHDAYKARKLRWFGIDRVNDKTAFDGERLYNASEVGYKYNMNNIAAAIGLGNLHGVIQRQARRKWVADQYDNTPTNIHNPNPVFREGSSNWLYTVLVDRRDDYIRMMRSKNIPVSVVHNGIDRNSIFGGIDRSLVNQRYWDEHHICLPCHSGLTDEDVQNVCDAVKGGW